ncbi:MAG: T9SS type A sorting domain-containing protein [Candidatus Cyclobacteriaceae bacterium M2_1C_046]
MIRTLLVSAFFFFTMVQTAVSQITTFPYLEDFETNDGGYTTTGTTWEYGTPSTLNTNLNQAYSGSKVWMMDLDGHYLNNAEEYLTSPVFDFSGFLYDPVISFYLKTDIETDWDKLSLQISTDGGLNFTTVGTQRPGWYNGSGNYWTGTSADYVQMSDTLIGTAGLANVQFRFKFTSDGSVTHEGAAIDDIRIVSSENFRIEGITPTSSSFQLTNSETLNITLKNNTAGTLTNVPLDITVYGPIDTVNVQETVAEIVQGNILIYTTSNVFDLSANGSEYYLVAEATVSDGSPEDNKDSVVFQTTSVYTGGLPYFQGFEDVESSLTITTDEQAIPGLEGFSFETDGLGNSRLRFNQISYEGSQAALLDNVSSLNYNTKGLVFMADFSALDVTTDVILLDLYYLNSLDEHDTEDQFYVRGSVNDPWIPFFNWSEKSVESEWLHFDDYIDITAILAANGQNYSQNFQLKFSQYDNFSYSSDGLALDNISLFKGPDNNLQLVDIIDPGYSTSLSASENITVKLRNAGINDQASFPLTLELYGPADTIVVTETITSTVIYGDTLSYTFSQAFDFSTEGDYFIKAYHSLASDTLNQGDTLKTSTGKMSVYTAGLPFMEDFEAVGPDLLISDSTAKINGIPGFSYFPEINISTMKSNAILTFDQGTAAEGNHAATFAGQNYSYGLGEMYLNIDLSTYTASADTLYLAFDVKKYPDEFETIYDMVRVRQDESSAWITVYDWGNNATTDYQKIIINLSEQLLLGGQDFTSNFQVQFGRYGYYRNGVSFDNMEVVEASGYDVGIINASVADVIAMDKINMDIPIEIYNYGTKSQENIEVQVKMYSGADTSVYSQVFPGPLLQGDTLLAILNTDFILSNLGKYEFEIKTNQANDSWASNDGKRFNLAKVDLFTASLPFVEDFEGTTVNQYDSTAYSIDGISGVSFLTDEGRLRFNSSYNYNNTKSAVLDSDVYGKDVENSLVVALDLSFFDVNQDTLLMYVEFNKFYDWVDEEDKIYIKGDAGSPWVVLFDWQMLTNSTYQSVSGLSLTEILKNAGQNFSGETLIKFNAKSYAYATSGGFGVDDIYIYAASDAPITGLTLDSNTIIENNAAGDIVGLLTGEDANLDETFTFELVSGEGSTDNASFTIDNNALKAATVFDFDTKSTYSVRIKATDIQGNFFEQVFTIYIINVNETPTALALSNNAINEMNAIGDVIGTFTTTDVDAGDSFTYTLVAGTGDADNNSFTIDGDQLKAAEVFDFETKNSYNIRIETTDSGSESFQKEFIITINDANEAPTDISLSGSSINENNAIADVIGTLSTTDENAGDTFTYTLVAGTGDTDNSLFTINADALEAADVFDFETQNSYSIRVQTSDGNGGVYEEVFTVSVNDVNEAPTALALSNNNIDENNASGDVIGTITTTDEDAGDTFTYSLVTGTGDADNGSFTITGDQLEAAEVFDFEVKNSYNIRVQTSDASGEVFEEAFTITVNDLNEAPTALSLNNTALNENNTLGDIIGSFTSTDEDASDSFTYTLVAGTGDTDNASFTITGEQLEAAEIFNFENKNSYSIRIQTMDAGGGIFEEAFTITVNDINEAPTAIALSNTTINENNAVGDVIGSISSTDEDAGDTFTYSLVTGTGDTDNSSFIVTDDQLLANQAFDFEAKESYSIRIQTSDVAGNTYVEVFTILINDIVPTQSQTIDFAEITDKLLDDGNTFELVATASSGLDVVFTVISGPATITGSTVELLEEGMVVIKAEQPGDDDHYLAADPVERTFVVSPVTAVGEDELSVAIEVYPNPANRYLFIKINLPEAQEVELRILDNNGKEVHTISTIFVKDHEEQIDISAYANGQYIIDYTVNGVRAHQKVIINN